MKTFNFYLLGIIGMLFSVDAWAYDFETDGIYYAICPKNKLEVEVTKGDWTFDVAAEKGYSGTVVIPDSVRFNDKTFRVNAIGNDAFYGCKGLNAITLNGVTAIGDDAFNGCTGLTSVELNDVISIGNNAFNRCSALSQIDLEKVASIGNWAFKGCKGITEINLENITAVGDWTFDGCTGLTSIDFKNVSTLGEGSFSNCTGLTELDLRKVTTIGNWAFSDCKNVSYINLQHVTSIGDWAFSNCNFSYDVKVYSQTPPVLHEHSFDNSQSWGTLRVPKGCINNYRNENYWNKFWFIDEFIDLSLHISCSKGGYVDIIGERVTNDSSKTFVIEQGIYHVLSIVPDEGFEVVSIMENGKEVVDYVRNNELEINIDENTTLQVTFGEKHCTPGDVNNDGTIDISDVTAVVSFILGTANEELDKEAADANGDGVIDVGDITCVVNIILSETGDEGGDAGGTGSDMPWGTNQLKRDIP